MAYDAVIFDVDGVLLDLPDQPFHEYMARTVRRSLPQYGIGESHPAYDEVTDALRAHDFDALETTAQQYGLDHHELWRVKEDVSVELQKEHVQLENGERSRRFFEDITILPELFEYCELGAVSNNNHDFIDYTMRAEAEPLNGAGSLSNLIRVYTGIRPTIEDHEKRKPNPHYIGAVADELGAKEVLFVGDSNADIEAAYRADADDEIAASVDSAFIWREHRLAENGEPDYELVEEPTYPLESLEDILDIVKNGHA